MAKNADHSLDRDEFGPNYSALSVSLRETLADLRPFPGRLATSWRVAVVCALVAGIAMMFHIPEAAISCYLVIFLCKADGAENTLIACAAVVAITLLVALMIPIVQLTVESAVARILVMLVVSVAFIFVGAASKLGEGGRIVALIIAFILTLVNAVPVNGVISAALRYAWEMAILPMAVIAAFYLFFGRWSVTLLRDELGERLRLAENALRGTDPAATVALRRKLEEGNDENAKRAMLVGLLRQTSASRRKRIRTDIEAGYQLLYSIAALPAGAPPDLRQSLRAHIGSMARALEQGHPLPAPAWHDHEAADRKAAGIIQALRNIAGTEKTNYEKGENDAFFAPDAFSNPVYLHFALKTTLAAILCYLFYSSINWQGIHTAMVTCYVASLGTAGDTIHKLGLRITGCLVGAALGMLSIIYLMPQMESVGSLMVLIFAVGLLAAWVTAGSEKSAYAGIQIGLAFTLTVLQGFGPTTDLETARDRIVGILVGNLAVYLTSTLIWPSPVKADIRKSFSKALLKLARLASAQPGQRLRKIATVSEIEKLIGEVRYYLYLSPFEPQSMRQGKDEEDNSRYIMDEIANIGSGIYFSNDDMQETAARLSELAGKVLSADLAAPISFTRAGAPPLYGSVEERVSRLETIMAGRRI